MPTTHTWNPAANGWIFDPTQYADGTPFVPGDTLVVNAGYPQAYSTIGPNSPLYTGTYIFNETGGADESLDLNNMLLDAASTIAVTGPQRLYWYQGNQFTNDGLVQVGTATASGHVYHPEVTSSTTQQSQLTNSGTIQVQNGSSFSADGDYSGSTLFNNPGGVVSVSNGSLFDWAAKFGATNANAVNNGLIVVQGAAARATSFDVQGDVSGTGVLSVRGAQGASPSDTSATIYGTANSTLDVTSGELEFYGNSSGGAINFLDNDGLVFLTSTANVRPFAAAITGFQAGDKVHLDGLRLGIKSFNYDTLSHALSLNYGDGSLAAQFTIEGNYTTSDLHVTSPDGGYSGWDITTTSTANAAPAFSTKDTTTGVAGSDAGQQYTDGAVAYLQSQYIWSGQDSVNVNANMPNVFLKGGPGNDALAASAGSNVIDGNLGSNFVVGASGGDGGRDTFFLDGSTGTTWDTVVNFHPGDSVTLWGYTPGQSVMAWTDNDGTPGYTGATIHAAFDGRTVNGSVTFAGIALADAQSKFSVSSGISGNGLNYLYVHYNG